MPSRMPALIHSCGRPALKLLPCGRLKHGLGDPLFCRGAGVRMKLNVVHILKTTASSCVRAVDNATEESRSKLINR